MFVAVRPPEEAVEHLDAFLAPRREAARFRWTQSDQWHLTLAFAEDVPERKLDDLVERLGGAAAKRRQVTARFAGGGAFPNVGRARVLWLGAEASDVVELDRLATGAKAAVTKAGAPVDGQRFRAHLTLARLGRPEEVSRWVRLLDAYDGPRWPVEELELVASYLGEGPRKRPRHEVVASFPLGRRS
jgi:2'-5' RNA ligase